MIIQIVQVIHLVTPNADDSVFGVTTTSGDPSGGLYGAGRFGYSLNDVTATAVAATTASAVSAGSGSVNFDSDYTANLCILIYSCLCIKLDH
jgi:hypothetical protein